MHTHLHPKLMLYVLLCTGIGACAIVDERDTESTPLPSTHEAAGGPVALGPQGPKVLIGAPPHKVSNTEKIVWTSKPPKDAEALLVAIDTPYQIFAEQGTYIHVASWLQNGTPASNARVFVGDLEVGQTDKTGTLVFFYPPEGATAAVTGSKVLRVVDASNPDRRGSVPFSPQLRTASFASDHLFVYTDRGVYRPSETVRMRVLGWHLKEDYSPLVEAHVDLLLKDPKGNVVGGTKLHTDAFGVAHMDLKIPATANDGLYLLEVAYKTERASARLQVKEFKPPVIQIEHTLGRFLTRDQEALAFDVSLKSSTGRTLKSANISVSASVHGQKRLSRTRDVRGEGPHRFAFASAELNELRKHLSEGRFFKMVLEVKDDLGRSDTLDRELRYTANPYIAVLEADKDQYTTGDPVELIAKLSDLDGVPVRNTPVTLNVGSERLNTSTNDAGLAKFSLEMPAQQVEAELFLDGVKASVARTRLRWSKPRPMRSHIKDPIIKERAKARVVVSFPADIEPVEDVVHMDIVDTSGALVNAVLLPIREVGEGFEASGEFHAPSWGSMLLTFFTLGRKKQETFGGDRFDEEPNNGIGLLTEGQNLIVQPNRTLNITLDGLPDKARPGEPLDLEVKVTDASGSKVRASIGAAIVDRRVIALKDPLEITPMDHFYNPELRTMSTTGSKILSWPVVSRNWGSVKLHDVALPPFPFLPGGPVARRSHGPGVMKAPPEPDEAMAPPPSSSSGSSLGDSFSAKSYDFEDAPLEGNLLKSADTLLQGSPTKQMRRASKAPMKTKPVQITIRTRFPETSLWAPVVISNDAGEAKISSNLPDAMTAQEVILVASDANGGVGVLREQVRVTQPAYLQADMPKALVIGESVSVPVMVHNRTERAQRFEVIFSAGEAAQKQELAVPAMDAQMLLFSLKATRSGELPYTISARSGDIYDEVQGAVRTIAAGVATQEVKRGVASAKNAFQRSWVIDPTASSNNATLHVTFPAISAAFLESEALHAQLLEDPLTIASDLASVASLLQYAQRNNLTSARVAALHERLIEAIAYLQLAQYADGAFGYWRHQGKSPFMTAWALESLLEAQQLDVAVDQEVIRKAANWLATHLKKDGLLDVSDVAFWQGDTAAMRVGLTAEVFDILTRVPSNLRTPKVNSAIAALTTFYTTYLERSDPDPLAAGRAVTALIRTEAIDAERARALVQILLTRRNRGHWEPSWFHAYAGNIEATVAVLTALHLIDPDGFQAEKRDALQYILSTRNAWGQWHNERGTLAAIRALLLVGAGAEEIAGVVTVKLDGKVVKSLTVDPKDPFLSTASLAHLDLAQELPAGKHTVTVAYSGKLAPSVMLVTRSWNVANTTSATGRHIQLEVKAARQLSVGQRGALEITVGQARPGQSARLIIGGSGLVEPALDRETTRKLLEAQDAPVVGLRATSRGFVVELSPSVSRKTLVLPLKALRVGQGAWPTVSLETRDERIAASAGALEIQP